MQVLKAISAERTFVEYGAMARQIPNGAENGAFLRLGFSF